jgi:hypothetical protein
MRGGNVRWIIGLVAAALAVAALAQPAPQTVVNVLDIKVLNTLEAEGFSLSEQLGGAKASVTADMYKANELYRSFADVVGKPLAHDPGTDQLPADIPANAGDIPEMVRLIRNFEDKGARSRNDTKGGYFIRHLSNNSQHPYTVERDGDEPRHFDERWLNSKYGEMKLIAVINRMDRADFDPSSCGEVRFIYRLSYRAPKSSSSLPFFLNVVKTYPKQADCSVFAKRWQLAAVTPAALKAGPLKDLAFKQMEVNFQSLRFTSGYMHDFGGQAMYMQRIFRIANGELEPVALENTPDVQAFEKNPALLQKLVAYLRQGDNLRRLDNGTLVIDDPSLMTKFSISWSTLGRARTANKPYSRIFQNHRADLESIGIANLTFIKSHDALVERLNNLTCMGCHQSGGMAGFHLPGYADDRYSHGFNKQQQALSPHATAETVRRKAYIEALAAGHKPNTFRPHSNFTDADWTAAPARPEFKRAAVGQLCVATHDFAGAPACGPIDGQPTSCQRTVTSKTEPVIFGECVVKGGRASAGAVCWRGEITEVTNQPADRGPIPAYNLFAFQDKWKLASSAYTGGEVGNLRCVLPQSGAPLGRASRKCTLDEENFAGIDPARKIPPQLCANQGGNGFDLCAAAGNSGACLEARVVRGMLDSCSPSRGCREDYICQKFPAYHKIAATTYGNIRANGQRANLSTPSQIRGVAIDALHQAEVGFCVPTYFLFNMRLDGHPSPVTGQPPGQPRLGATQVVRGYR